MEDIMDRMIKRKHPYLPELEAKMISICHKKFLTLDELGIYLNLSQSFLQKNYMKYYAGAIVSTYPNCKKIVFDRERVDRLVDNFTKTHRV